ncbi:hypothetical protein BT69DRAFT_1279314 [Atractiella rhizophila]|nr:hypothetical protein BT69DRAFT_1279314 [Atractiella rhizophila]
MDVLTTPHALTVLTCSPTHTLQRTLHHFSGRFQSVNPGTSLPTSLPKAYKHLSSLLSSNEKTTVLFLLPPPPQLLALLLHPTTAHSVLHVHLHHPQALEEILQRYSVSEDDVRIWDLLPKMQVSYEDDADEEGEAIIELFSRLPNRTPLVIRHLLLLSSSQPVPLPPKVATAEPKVNATGFGGHEGGTTFDIHSRSEEQEREREKVRELKPWSVEYTMEKEDDWDEEEADEDLGF